MSYTVKKLADLTGVSVRTLHYYDEVGLLKPESRTANRYRHYGEDSTIILQQVLFFRELGFSLEEIKEIIAKPEFDVRQALKYHRIMLQKKAERIRELIGTVDKTIRKMKGEITMDIKEYYQGFSEEQIEEYRREVKQRWGEKTLEDSEKSVLSMGKEKFAVLQAAGDTIFQAIAVNMAKGYDSPEVQAQVSKWRKWLENFHHYSDEAVLGLGRAYSEDARFAKFYRKYHKNMPGFFTKAIEYYCEHQR